MAASFPAWADSTDQDKALAASLFDEGRALLSQGKVSDACRKLEESQRLDPLPGTLINLAACHEQEGLTASAVAEFRQARALAQRDHRDDRVAVAEQHLTALESKVSMLVIVVSPEADRPDLTVSHDGTAIGRTVWGTRIPVNPGDHIIEVSAPNRKTWRSGVKVGPNGDVQTVAVAPLEEEAPAPPAVAEPVATPQPAPAEVARPQGAGLSTRRSVAIVAAGVGVVAVGVGSYFGIRAIEKHNDPLWTCPQYPCSQTLYSEAKDAATASTVTFAVGGAALAAAAILGFSDSRRAPPTNGALRVLPAVGLGQAGVDVSGRF